MKGDGCVYMSLARFGSRNKRMLDKEIERGIGKGMDPMRLADELYQRAESRKVCFAFAPAWAVCAAPGLHECLSEPIHAYVVHWSVEYTNAAKKCFPNTPTRSDGFFTAFSNRCPCSLSSSFKNLAHKRQLVKKLSEGEYYCGRLAAPPSLSRQSLLLYETRN